MTIRINKVENFLKLNFFKQYLLLSKVKGVVIIKLILEKKIYKFKIKQNIKIASIQPIIK